MSKCCHDAAAVIVGCETMLKLQLLVAHVCLHPEPEPQRESAQPGSSLKPKGL